LRQRHSGVVSLAAGTNFDVCINGTTLSTCSSNVRYKEEIENLALGEPWNDCAQCPSSGRTARDHLGCVAEEVAPSIHAATYRDGQIEGVKPGNHCGGQCGQEQRGLIEAQGAEIAALRAGGGTATSARGGGARRARPGEVRASPRSESGTSRRANA
jgi:hypothetical protein